MVIDEVDIKTLPPNWQEETAYPLLQLLVNGSGFSFDTLTDSFNVFQNTGSGYLTATALNYSLTDYTITSSNFAPVPYQ